MTLMKETRTQVFSNIDKRRHLATLERCVVSVELSVKPLCVEFLPPLTVILPPKGAGFN
jgi:hypothetical protein